MSRLTKRAENGQAYIEMGALPAAADKLAKWEDADEKGLLVVVEDCCEGDEGILTIVECHCEDCTYADDMNGSGQTICCKLYECYKSKNDFCNHARKRKVSAAEIVENTKCETDFEENETVSAENETETVEIDTENVLDAAEILNAEADSRRLTESDDLGNWGVKGLPWKELQVGQVITQEISEKLYGCLCKLKDYEKTGLSPEEVERLQEER
ncbi:MAG: hypothetical protein IJW37_02660 [Lachnospiraceae bacterium]|nr:hypothetical protein [Lachnospiraceae bacterium]